MILYYLIAGAFSVLSVLTIWSYVLMSRVVFKVDQKFEILTRQLQTQGKIILELKEDLLYQQDTTRILKRNLFKCLDVNSTQHVPVKEHVNNPPKNKRGRPKKQS